MEPRYFIRYNPTKEFVQMLYKLTTNDKGSLVLLYYGEQGGWHYSFSYNDKQEEFINSDLTQEVTKEEIQEYIEQANTK